MKRQVVLGFLAGLGLLMAAPAARADVIVDISNDPNYSWTWAEDLTLGYQFSVSAPITFNALAVFDVTSANPATAHTNAAGLNAIHNVAVWDSAGAPVAQTTVQQGDPTTASANTYGVWVYRLLGTTVTLSPGTYTIGAFYAGNSDPVMVQQTTLAAPNVAYIGGRYVYSPTFQRPTGAYPPNEQQYFGPTMLSVPDGGMTLVLLGGALTGIGLMRRRARG